MRPVSEPEKKADTSIRKNIRPSRIPMGISFSKEGYASKVCEVAITGGWGWIVKP
jgi:hypothetical protein